MELAICFLGDNNFYGLDNHYIIHHSITYSCISTNRKIKTMYSYIKDILEPNKGLRELENIPRECRVLE